MLSRLHKDKLNKRRPELVDEIDADCLFPHLRKRSLLTSRQEDKIKLNGKSIRSEQVEAILDIVPRLGKHAFVDFCSALTDSGQQRIVDDYLSDPQKENNKKTDSDSDNAPPMKKLCEDSSNLSTTSVSISNDTNQKPVDITPDLQQSTSGCCESVSGHPPAAMENISRIELPHRSTATVEPRVLDDPCDDLGDDPCDDDLDDPNSAVPDLSCDCRGVDFERLRNFADIFDGASSVTDDDSGEFQVLQCTPDFYHRNSYDAYLMNRQYRGYALIINVSSVEGSLEPVRIGTLKDCENLTKLWISLNFKVIVYNDEDDLTAKGIKEKIDSFSQMSGQRFAQCTVVNVLSHGENGCIYGTDGEKVSVHFIKRTLDALRCPALAGKPKLIFLEACRGDLSDKIESDDVCDSKSQSDFLIGYPSQPGYKAWRNGRQGSWYIFALVRVFARLSCSSGIHSLMTVVNRLVSSRISRSIEPEDSGNTQMPEVSHSLTKNLFFFPGVFLKDPRRVTP